MKSKKTTSTRVYTDTKKHINAVVKKTRMSSAQIVKGWMDKSTTTEAKK